MKRIILTESQYKRLVRQNLNEQRVVYEDPKDEKDINYDMFSILDSVAYILDGAFNKKLYVKKIEDGKVYIDKTKYTQEEIDYIRKKFKILVNMDLSNVDKMFTNDSDLGFDSGVDSDYDWGDEEFVWEVKTSNVPESDSSWYLKEQTALRWYNQTDTVYFKDSKISVSGVIYERYNNEKFKICAEYVDGVKNGFYNEYYDNGQLRKKYFNKNGSISGEYIEYFEDGKLRLEEFYKDGSILYMTEYRRDSSIRRIKTKPDENEISFSEVMKNINYKVKK